MIPKKNPIETLYTEEDERITPDGLKEVLTEKEEAFPEFVGFYKKVLGRLDEDSTRDDIKTALTLNPKLSIELEASWLHEEGELREDLWYEMQKFVYASAFNDARDEVRDSIEQKYPQLAKQGWWDHLEVFVDQKLIQKEQGERRRQANQRIYNTNEGPLPEYPQLQEAFMDFVTASGDFYTLRALSRAPEQVQIKDEERTGLYVLEQLASSTKHQNFLEAQKEGAAWIEEYQRYPDRERKIRIIRAIRHGHLDLKETLKALNTPEERIKEIYPIAGPVLRQNMRQLTTKIEEGATFEELANWVANLENLDEEKQKELETIFKEMGNEV